jgi:hypothetical protein
MAQGKRAFGRVTSAATSSAPVADEAGPSEEVYAEVIELARQSAARAGTEPGLFQQLVHLFTRSQYRQWLWIIGAIVAFVTLQFMVFGDAIVMPDRLGHDYVAGNAPREAAHIVDFALDGDGFHEASDLMAENLRVGGTLINTTDERIWQITVRATVRDCTGDLEGADCPVAWDGVITISADVPPGGQLELDEQVPVSKLPVLAGQPWTEYEMLAVSTR